MTAIESGADRLLPPAASPAAQVGGWGMVLFICNEAALFACLVASYFYLGVSNPAWPPAGIEKPVLRLPIIMTVLLVSSSVVLLWAERQHTSGHRAAYRAGTVVTIVLGLGFLALQAREYADKLAHVRATENAYTSMFFTITGLHGTHVAFGVLMLLWALCREIAGTAPPHALAIRNTSLYWHFVDAVWLVILTSLYLSPRWY